MDAKQPEALVVIAFTTGHKSYSRGEIAQFPAEKFAELKAEGFVTEAPVRPPSAEGDASANAASGGMPGGLASSGDAVETAPTEKRGKR